MLADDSHSLILLAACARSMGYDSIQQEKKLTIKEVSLADALALNARFGAEIIISCELRRDPPVFFT